MTTLPSASIDHCDLKPTLEKFGLKYEGTAEIPAKGGGSLVVHNFVFPDSEHGVHISDIKGMKSWSGFIGKNHYGHGYGKESLIIHLKKRLARYREVIGK